jgi:hypothetical protein
MQGYPPLKTMTLKIKPQFGLIPTYSRKSFAGLIGHTTVVSVIFVHTGPFIMGFFTSLLTRFEPLSQREHSLSKLGLLGPK